MSEQSVLSGEAFSHKVSAEYENEQAAKKAVDSLVKESGIPLQQIRVVQPHDPAMARKIEPEASGIGWTLVKSHAVLGCVGLVLGLCVATILVYLGPPITRSSPVLTFIAFGIVLPLVGMLIAGAISLRPDHDLLVDKTRAATDAGHWTVIAHCSDSNEQRRAKAAVDQAAQTL